MPCSTLTVASGRVEDALQQAAAGADAAEQERDRHDRQRVLAREERDQDARVAVAGDQRGVGGAVNGRDLDRARQPGAQRRRESSVTITSRPTPAR